MAKPKKAELQRYCDLRERKRVLESEARSIGTEIDQLADLVMSYLEELGKDSAKIHGFQVLVSGGNAHVAWAQEYVKLAGADAAAKLKADAPRQPKLTVTPPTE